MSLRLVPTVRRGDTLKPGRYYRITEIDPTDPEPSCKVGDVLKCTVDPGAGELAADWFADFGGSWFGDFLEQGSFGTLIIGLVEVPPPGVA